MDGATGHAAAEDVRLVKVRFSAQTNLTSRGQHGYDINNFFGVKFILLFIIEKKTKNYIF